MVVDMYEKYDSSKENKINQVSIQTLFDGGMGHGYYVIAYLIGGNAYHGFKYMIGNDRLYNLKQAQELRLSECKRLNIGDI